MTALSQSTPCPSSLTASQNTAPVVEFKCLFTHDVRRKQKRWQDGYLKCHTFNNRVMLYDLSRNFLGDTYHKDGNELYEGDELNLDKGIMVEVAEAMGVTQTDLTPLFEKRAAELPAKNNAPPRSRPFQKPSSVAPSSVSRTAPPPRHRSLKALLGIPNGPVGKAVPMQSPFQSRIEKENEAACQRTPKRQKMNHPPAPREVTGPLQEVPSGVNQDWPIPIKSRAQHAQNSMKPAVPATAITLNSELDYTAIISAVTVPESPDEPTKLHSVSTSSAAMDSRQRVGIPVQVPRKVPLPKAKTTKVPRQPTLPSSPPVCASNRLSNVDSAAQLERPQPTKAISPQTSSGDKPKTKSLRLSKGVKRGKLLCQSSSEATDQPAIKTAGLTRRTTQKVPPARQNQERLVQERASKVFSDPIPQSEKSRERSNTPIPVDISHIVSPIQASLDEFDDPDVVQGMMDEQLLVASPPPHPCKKSPKLVINARQPSPRRSIRREKAPREPSKPYVPARGLGQLFRDQLPTHGETPTVRPRASSTLSTTKALSSGGFRKTLKASKQSSITHAAEPLLPPSRNESVPLPPHPLLASQRGPPMTSTEFAAILLQPQNTHDAIRVKSSTPKRPTKRTCRRVHSENDAPIPSTSDTWEKKNLPRTSSILSDMTTDPEIDATARTTAPTPLTSPPRKQSGLLALTKKTDPRRKLQRAQSLHVDTFGLAYIGEEEAVEDVPSPVVDGDVGAWSTEAGDLFDWKPPERCCRETSGGEFVMK